MTKQVQIADGSTQEITVGDKIKLLDGREMVVSDFGKFGRIAATDAQGALVQVRPVDILEIIKEVTTIVEEAKEAVAKAKTFWAWFQQTQIGGLILSIFKKKGNA